MRAARIILTCLFLAACAGADDGSDSESVSNGNYSNPLLGDGHGHVGYCGAPNVRKFGPHEYVLACASAGIGTSSEAYHLWSSSDLVSWHSNTVVFTDQSHPGWAQPPGAGPGFGSYWCPEIYRIDGRAVLLFAASRKKSNASGGHPKTIGQATATYSNGHWGAWDTSGELLANQGSGVIANDPENAIAHLDDDGSGRIDPTLLFDEKKGEVYRDPGTGYMTMYYVYQPRNVRMVKVKSDGHGHLSRVPGTDHEVMLEGNVPFSTTLAWEKTVVEGVEAQVREGKTVFLFYSGASAWDATYAMGVAKAATPEGPFTKRSEPILSTGASGEFVGPGHGSQWVIGPNGKMYLPYRVQRRDAQGHFAPQIMMLEELGFDGEWPFVKAGDHPKKGPFPAP